MSLFLSKLLSLFIYPFTLGLLIIVGGGILGYWWNQYGWIVVGLGLLVMWIPATPLISGWLQGTLEHRFPPRPVREAPSADAIVTLGGSVGPARPPRVYPDLKGTADRVWHAARLYHAGKAPWVIASGGTQPWKDPQFREATAIELLLTSWNVPADSILMETTSASTYGNATNTAEILEERGFDRVLLVTSALHMRRALATFRSVGVEAVPAATDYGVVEGETTLLSLIPSVGALNGSTAAIHEYVGYIVYDWRGWIEEEPLGE